jgi:hypothetical protein
MKIGRNHLMAKNVQQIIDEQCVTRRSFLGTSLKAGAGIVGIIAGSGAIGTLLMGCSKTPSVNYEFASVPDDTRHIHQVTILGADLDSPPSQKVVTTTLVFTHTHDVTMTKADFESLKNGQTFTKTCTSTGTPLHSHSFSMKKS